MTLYPFQSEGVRSLLTRKSILLADEMGLGKTVQAATALKELFEQRAIRRALIICPASLCLNWKHEIARWCGRPSVIYQGADRYGMLEGSAPILIGSFETLSADLQRVTHGGEQFYDIGIDVLIIDEAQRIKTPEGLRSKVISKIVAPRRWAITGTPLENHPRELASILRFLEPNEFLRASDIQDVAKILEFANQLILRRTKDEVGLELPAKTVARVKVALLPEQASEYLRAREGILQSIKGMLDLSSATTVLLQGLQELRRIAVISDGGESSKIDLVEEEMEEIASRGEKAVIFSSFANLALPQCASRLSKFGALLYTGSMTTDERQLVHQRFLHDPEAKVICASLRAAGVGLTWTVASHVYHLDSWWNPQVLNQADDRVHRIGQNRPVLIKRLIAEETIEEAIEGLLDIKEDIFELVIGDRPLSTVHASPFSSLLSLIQDGPSEIRAVG